MKEGINEFHFIKQQTEGVMRNATPGVIFKYSQTSAGLLINQVRFKLGQMGNN